MDVRDLKEEILNRELISDILAEIGCHHIRDKGDYYTCGNPDGDNPGSIVVYKNEYISCTNYTRQITKNGRQADIFDLVAYAEDCSFAEATRFVCELAGISYYGEREDIPESLQILKLLKEMSVSEDCEDDSLVKPIPEQILSYYLPYPNKMFEDDGITLEIQQDFGIGYDPQTNRVTIPIRTPLGDLCGVKGRLFGVPDEHNPKYLYIEPTVKAKLLYGLYENNDYIKNSKFIYVVESEKAVQQLATIGVRNAVSTSGKAISKTQVELITRTGCIPIFAYDQDVQEDELQEIASMFMDGIDVYAIIDRGSILDEKESPSDNPNKWNELTKNHIYKIKGGNSND